MISALSLARSYSANLALGILKDGNSSSNASSMASPISRLLGGIDLDHSSTGLDGGSLSVLLQALHNLSNADGQDGAVRAPDGFIGSKTFMNALKDKLDGAAGNPMSYVNFQAMMQAMKDGTLKVTNPATGETVTAYDPAGGKSAGKIETGDSKAWNTFLQDHLKRESDGSFAKSADGSYIDAKTGGNAYFEKVGGEYYYFTWPGKMSADV